MRGLTWEEITITNGMIQILINHRLGMVYSFYLISFFYAINDKK